MSGRELPAPLLALTPGELSERDISGFCRKASLAMDAGLAALLVREPALGDRALVALCAELTKVMEARGWLGLHDRVHLADAVGARGVHVGFRSLAPSEARRLVSGDVVVGVSAHAGDGPERRVGADYLLFGPVLDTPSKRGVKDAVSFDGLALAVAETELPVYAIGGLKPEHAARVRASGARGLAVLSGIFGAVDPALEVRRYLEAWSS